MIFITEQRASLAAVGDEQYIVTAICSSAKKSPFLLHFEPGWVVTRRLLLPFEELALGPGSLNLIKEAARGEQSADPSGNTYPRLAHPQNNSEHHPGQKLSLGSAMAKLPHHSGQSKRDDSYREGNGNVLGSYGTESDICGKGLIS